MARVLAASLTAGVLLSQAPIQPARAALVTVEIRTATTSSLVVAPSSPTTVGQAVKLTANVKKAPGLIDIYAHLLTPIEILIRFGSSIPSILTGNEPVTGSVSFMDGSTVLATVTLANGTASLTTTGLGAGTHNLRAVYAASGHWAGSTSSVVVHEVTRIATSTTLAASPNPSSAGQQVVLTGTVSPSSATGSVEFFDGVTSLGSASVVGGVASLSTGSLSVGNHSLTATYGGDSNHQPSTSSALTQSVMKVVTSTLLTVSPNPVVVGDPAVLTATVSPSSATGSVEFFDGVTSLGSASVLGGVASMSTSSWSVGDHTLTATYGGDPTHAASSSAAVVLRADPAQAPANVNRPTITGVPGTGHTLTANNSLTDWSHGVSSPLEFQWQKCAASGSPCADIPGATSSTYAVAYPGDLDSQIQVRVTATNQVGSTSATSEQTRIQPAPNNIGIPVIERCTDSGCAVSAPIPPGSAPFTGDTLETTDGTWQAGTATAFSYQWIRCNSSGAVCAPIAGATGNVYLVSADDLGNLLEVMVTASNDNLDDSAQPVVTTSTSAASAVVSPPEPPSSP